MRVDINNLQMDINDEDYLFVLKEDDVETIEQIKADFYIFKDYVNIWGSACNFDNTEVRILNNFRDKFCYLLSSLHEDTLLIDIFHKFIPDILIKLPESRYARGYNFKYWQDKLGFSIEEFLTNKKYVVISDARYSVENLINLGLFDFNNVDKCSSVDFD